MVFVGFAGDGQNRHPIYMDTYILYIARLKFALKFWSEDYVYVCMYVVRERFLYRLYIMCSNRNDAGLLPGMTRVKLSYHF